MFRHLVGLVLVGSLVACGSSEPPPAAPGKPLNPPTEDNSLDEFMKELPTAKPVEPAVTAAPVVTAAPTSTATPTATPTGKPTATPTGKPTATTAKPTAPPKK
jgi:hypothetical protein